MPDNEIPPSNGKTESPTTASAKVVSKHVATGRPPGRPRKDGQPSGMGMAKNPPGVKEEIPFVPSELDIEYVKTTVSQVLELVDSFFTSKVKSTVNGFGTGLEKQAEQYAYQVAISEKEIDLVSSASGRVAAKHEVLIKWAPEMMLAGWGVAYSGRVVNTMRDLNALAAQVKKHREELAKRENPLESDATKSPP